MPTLPTDGRFCLKDWENLPWEDLFPCSMRIFLHIWYVSSSLAEGEKLRQSDGLLGATLSPTLRQLQLPEDALWPATSTACTIPWEPLWFYGKPRV